MNLSKLPVMPKHKVVAGAFLVALLLLVVVLTPTAFAESTETAVHNITVDTAHDMITDGSFPDLVILDVRNQSEYDLGHLYDAILVPYYELETRIGEFEEHMNHEIVVYCGLGGRSQVASEILTDHGFTKVYNMLGGITAWMEAGYPIYTTFHHVTVNTFDEQVYLEIEPLLLQMGCTSCGGNQGCPSEDDSEITNFQTTVLEEEEGYTVTLVTYEVGGTTVEVTVTRSLLWSYNDIIDEINRTARFVAIEITTEDTSTQFYSLSYLVQHTEYNLTLYTSLTPLNSETYNNSFTIMDYAPAEKSEVTSLEAVEFNSSVTLSQQYAILGKVAKEMGKVYEKSGDETLAQLAGGYYTMEEEAKYLSKLVEKQLTEYNRVVFGVTEGMVGVLSLDPELIKNGGFESGSSYWTLGGAGDHSVTTGWYHSGSYSLRLGNWIGPNTANSRDEAYQMITIPANAINVKFSFWYRLETEDSVAYDWFDVYVAPVGGEPSLVFKKGGASRWGYEYFGWSKVTYDLSAYAGQTIYVYFSVANWYDTSYYTYCLIDDVSVTYEIPTTPSGCNWECVLDCVLQNPEVLANCMYVAYICSIAPIPANPACWALIACVLIYGIGCAIACCSW